MSSIQAENRQCGLWIQHCIGNIRNSALTFFVVRVFQSTLKKLNYVIKKQLHHYARIKKYYYIIIKDYRIHYEIVGFCD